MMRFYFVLLGLVTAMLASVAFADSVFRWTDESGVVNYGSAPPQSVSAKKTVRVVDVTPALTDYASPDELRARHDLAQALFAAEDARLRRQLLEEQIATEHARGEALRAQADMMAAQTIPEDPCIATNSCDYNPVVFIGRPQHFRYIRPIPGQPPRPHRAASLMPTPERPMGLPGRF